MSNVKYNRKKHSEEEDGLEIQKMRATLASGKHRSFSQILPPPVLKLDGLEICGNLRHPLHPCSHPSFTILNTLSSLASFKCICQAYCFFTALKGKHSFISDVSDVLYCFRKWQGQGFLSQYWSESV